MVLLEQNNIHSCTSENGRIFCTVDGSEIRLTGSLEVQDQTKNGL